MAKDLLLRRSAPRSFPRRSSCPRWRSSQTRSPSELAEARLTHGAMRTFGTPRRLAVLVDGRGRAQRGHDRKEVSARRSKAAFDADGTPTQRGDEVRRERRGSPVDRLERVHDAEGRVPRRAKVEEKGRPRAELLPDVLDAGGARHQVQEVMRWGDVEQTFARPVHWIVALFGEEVRAGRRSAT